MAASCEDMLRQDTLPSVEEDIEINQDSDMILALDSVSGEEMPRQDALVLGHQATQQDNDVESDRDEEDQVMRLLEGKEATPATGKRSHKLSMSWQTNSPSYDQRIMARQMPKEHVPSL